MQTRNCAITVLMDLDGGNLRRLTDNSTTVDWLPIWSPDGRQLLFNSRRDGNLEIYVMDGAGAEQGSATVQRLTNNRADDFNAVWQPRPVHGLAEAWPLPTAIHAPISLTQSPPRFPGRYTVQIGLGDLDADGALDAVSAATFGNASNVIWLNDG